jgi:hypothetical protein
MNSTVCDECHGRWGDEEHLQCHAPRDCLIYGPYVLDAGYRKMLWEKHSFYTIEEVIGSYLGKNPLEPSQRDWLNPPSSEEDE